MLRLWSEHETLFTGLWVFIQVGRDVARESSAVCLLFDLFGALSRGECDSSAIGSERAVLAGRCQDVVLFVTNT